MEPWPAETHPRSQKKKLELVWTSPKCLLSLSQNVTRVSELHPYSCHLRAFENPFPSTLHVSSTFRPKMALRPSDMEVRCIPVVHSCELWAGNLQQPLMYQVVLFNFQPSGVEKKNASVGLDTTKNYQKSKRYLQVNSLHLQIGRLQLCSSQIQPE